MKWVTGYTNYQMFEAYGIAESTVIDIVRQNLKKKKDIVRQVVLNFCDHYMHYKIGWPAGQEGVFEVLQDFNDWMSTPGVVRALDKTELKIKRPKICRS